MVKHGDEIADGAKNVFKLSENSIQHISKHIPNDFARQVKYLTDDQLAAKLAHNTFFDPSWSKSQVISAVETGYKQLMDLGLTGVHDVVINGETIRIAIKSYGTFDTAFGLRKLTLEFFGR